MLMIIQQLFNNMSIYTKTGDLGETSIIGGKRVSKNSPRVNAYGDVDELISHIGLLRCQIPNENSVLRRIQINLMMGSAILASEVENKKTVCFSVDEITFLEKEIDRMTVEMPQQIAFILPGAPAEAALCHIARTVCRRAERSSIAIKDDRDGIILTIKYLNRLSDYLFTLGRYQCHLTNISEDFWLP